MTGPGPRARGGVSPKLEPLVVDYAGDPQGCQRAIVELTEEYQRYVESEHAMCPGCPVVRSGPFVVYSMLEWKAIYAGGSLGHWTRDDIQAYLLDHYPRKVSADRRLQGDTPACIRDFVYFMSDRGTLAGDDLDALADAADEVLDDFLAANGDRRNWGTAKSMMLGGAGIVDAADEPSIGVAGEPRAPSRAGPGPAPPRSGQPGAAARREKRKSARVARRRNRR